MFIRFLNVSLSMETIPPVQFYKMYINSTFINILHYLTLTLYPYRCYTSIKTFFLDRDIYRYIEILVNFDRF